MYRDKKKIKKFVKVSKVVDCIYNTHEEQKKSKGKISYF